MKKIGGNVTAYLERKTIEKNDIGEDIMTYTIFATLKGFLDLSSGSATYQTYNAKIQESTHMFVCDFKELSIEESECRLRSDNKVYDVLYIDNPMGLNKHLEFYLRYVGA